MDKYTFQESKNLNVRGNIQPEKADSLNYQQAPRNTGYQGQNVGYDQNPIVTSFGDGNFY